MEHTGGFRYSYLADPHEDNEKRAHQDLRGPDIADGREAGGCGQHKGAQLRRPADTDVLSEVPNRQLVVRSQPLRRTGEMWKDAGLRCPDRPGVAGQLSARA